MASDRTATRAVTLLIVVALLAARIAYFLDGALPLNHDGAGCVWASCIALAWLLSRWLGLLPAAIAVFGFVPTSDTAVLGQINAVVACLTATALGAVANRRDAVAGISLAVGALLKLGPVAGLVVLATRRHWRAVIPAAVAWRLRWS